MEFHRRLFSIDGFVPGQAALPFPIDSGLWAVQEGCSPPAAHDPARLLQSFAALEGVAVSLRTDAVLMCQAGAGLTQRLAHFGLLLGDLAALALHEIIINAAVHGNLQVASRPGARWCERQAFFDAIERELTNCERAARAVTVALGWDTERLCATVIDEGAGYDVHDAIARAPGETAPASGRGIAIARAAARVEVLDGGTCTRLIFDRIDGARPT